MQVKVDGIGLNATHYAKMDEAAAVADMTLKTNDAMGVATAHGKDAAWAKGAHAACVAAVNKAVDSEKEAAKKKASSKP